MQDLKSPFHTAPSPHRLSQNEIRRIFAAARTERDRVIMAVLLDTGVKLPELASITRERIKKGSVIVSGRDGNRAVPISPRVREMLLRQGDKRHVWVARKGPMRYSSLRSIVRRTMARAGFSDAELIGKSLRYTFAVTYVLRGGSVHELRYILGHPKLATTLRYIGMSLEISASRHSQLSPLAELDFDWGSE